MSRLVHSFARTTLTGVLLAGMLATPASAHAVAGSRFDSPLPLPLLLLGAGATVALTALWLVRTDRTTAPSTDRELLTIPAGPASILQRLLGVMFLACVLLALLAGVLGRQVPAENSATVFTWAVWFRGIAFVAILVGNPWPFLSPWRTVVDALTWIEGAEFSLVSSSPGGMWPATAGFLLIFGVVENLTNVPLVPRLTTALITVYALLVISGTVAFGQSWLDRADPLGVFYRLFATVSPFRIDRRGDRYRVALRYPWEGALTPVGGPALVVFAVAMVYVVSFDGFTDTSTFQTVLFQTREALGVGSGATLVLFGVGMGSFLGAFVAGCWLCERLGGVDADTLATAKAFAPTLLPIAAAYEISHNYPYVARSLGQLVGIVAEPFAPGLGTIEPLGWLPLPVFWGSQVFMIVLGHVVAVVAAHFVAVERYGSLQAARRAHLPLVVLMVGYTVLSLWIVSQPVVA